MVGEWQVRQKALFYGLSFEEHVPADDLLRAIDWFVELSDIQRQLKPFHSAIGRWSVDPELMIRILLKGMHGTQAGDPLKAAAAIEAALQAERTPLRLQFGEDAIAAVRGHAETLLADLAAWEAVGAATAIES